MQVLDLSYNGLSADSITYIGGLPRLKVLHLTGNQLRHLPPDLGFSHHGATQLLVPLFVNSFSCSLFYFNHFNSQVSVIICLL